MMKPPNILTIAGSDSGGGAGIQADLKTMTAMGTYGMSVITALTAQNGEGVAGIYAPPADFAALQLRTVLEGFPVHAAKTGMLFNAEIITAIADILDGQSFPLVVDPVCVSTSGHKLLQDDAVDVLRSRLIPRADLLTPNRPEAELFAGMPIRSDDDAVEAGRRILDLGAKAVLVKGGHCEGKPIFLTDWLLEPDSEPVPLRQPYIDTQNTHGTGCTLSAGIAAQLGLGMPLSVAVKKAQEFLNKALRSSFNPGKGFGPVNHLAGRA